MIIIDHAARATSLLRAEMLGWFEAVVRIMPNLVVAVVVLALAFFVSRLAGRLAQRLLEKTSESHTVTRIITAFVRLIILFFGLFGALGILNLEKTVTSLLAGAGVLGLALGFAFQEIFANFFSGILIALRKPYREGDIIEVVGIQGKVVELNLRTTNIRTFSGLDVLIPNKDMFTKAVTNLTSTPDRRVEVKIGVAYNSNLRTVEAVAREAVENISGRIPEKETDFWFTGFGDSAINFEVRFWVEYPGKQNYLRAIHACVLNIKEAFEREGINIPFPIRTLDYSLAPKSEGEAAPASPASSDE